MGKNLVQHFIQSDYRMSVSDVLKNAIAGNETANFEIRLESRHGEALTALLNATRAIMARQRHRRSGC